MSVQSFGRADAQVQEASWILGRALRPILLLHTCITGSIRVSYYFYLPYQSCKGHNILSAVVWWFCSSPLISRLATPPLPPICQPLLDITYSTFRPTSQVRYLEVHKEAVAAAKEEKGGSSAKSGK